MDTLNGFLLGISAGVNCFFMCCPYLFPFFIAQKRTIKKNLFLVIEYLSGRLSAYLIIGILSAALGIVVGEFKSASKIYSFLLIFSSLLLFMYNLGLIFEIKFLNIKAVMITNRIPFLTGFLNGFNFCPPLITAFSYGVAEGNIYKNILFFILFFLGSAIYILPFIFTDFLAKVENLKNAGRIAGVFVAVWFFIHGIYLLFKV